MRGIDPGALTTVNHHSPGRGLLSVSLKLGRFQPVSMGNQFVLKAASPSFMLQHWAVPLAGLFWGLMGADWEAQGGGVGSSEGPLAQRMGALGLECTAALERRWCSRRWIWLLVLREPRVRAAL